MARFRLAGRSVADRSNDQIAVTRASLEAEASRCRSSLEQGYADLGACRQRAAESAAAGNDPVGVAPDRPGAVSEAEERLERIRRWQYRIDQEASEFLGIASRFRALLEDEACRAQRTCWPSS